jgi:hypothetical protein
MDKTHLELLELIALLAAPFIFAIVGSALAWRSVTRPVLFFVVSILSLCGLGSFAFPIANDLFNASGSASAVYPSSQFNALVAYDILVATTGFPVLFWLRSAIRRP